MKTMILAALAVLSLSIGSAYAQSRPEPAVSALDSGWCNG
jgi:hypothetical protein